MQKLHSNESLRFVFLHIRTQAIDCNYWPFKYSEYSDVFACLFHPFYNSIDEKIAESIKATNFWILGQILRLLISSFRKRTTKWYVFVDIAQMVLYFARKIIVRANGMFFNVRTLRAHQDKILNTSLSCYKNLLNKKYCDRIRIWEWSIICIK